MEPATKKVRIEQPAEDRARLKPSQVTAQSNIFGPIKATSKFTLKNPNAKRASNPENDEDQDDDDEEADEEEGSDEEIANDSDISGDDEDDEFNANQDEDDDNDDDESENDDADKQSTNHLPKRRKNDPSEFANAMQKILSSTITKPSSKQPPILARSLESKKLDTLADDARLEKKVRHLQAVERKRKLETGRNKTIVGHSESEMVAIIERERGMRKVAQRGVVRLFNAIRAAQLVGGQGADGEGGGEGGGEGVRVRQGAGVKKREVKAQELSKSSFLDLIKSGGRVATSSATQ